MANLKGQAQRGGSINYFQGPYYQNGGNGFGGFFKGVVNFFKPIAAVVAPLMKSPLAKGLARDVISTGLDIVTETIRGKKFKQSAKDNLQAAKKRIMSTIHENTRPIKEDQLGGAIKMAKFSKINPAIAAVLKMRRKTRKRKKNSGVRKKIRKTKSKKKSAKKNRKKTRKHKKFNTVFD